MKQRSDLRLLFGVVEHHALILGGLLLLDLRLLRSSAAAPTGAAQPFDNSDSIVEVLLSRPLDATVLSLQLTMLETLQGNVPRARGSGRGICLTLNAPSDATS